MRREQLLRTLDKLDDIRFNQMGLLESRDLIQNKYEEVRKEIRKVDRRIIRIEFVLNEGCFLCQEGGIVFM